MDLNAFTLNLAVSMVLILGNAGSASANSVNIEGCQGATLEQETVIGKIYSEYGSKSLPLQKKIIIKQSELEALLYENNEQNTIKIQSVIKDIAVLKAQNYAVRTEMQNKLSEAGVYLSPSRVHSEHRMMNRHDWMDSDYRGCGYHW